MPSDRYTVIIGANVRSLSAGLRKAQTQVNRFRSAIAKPLSVFGGMLGAGALSGGLTLGLSMIGREAISLGSKISDLAARTRTTAEEFQVLRDYARDAGVDMGTLERGLRNVTNRMQQALDGNTTYRRSVERLGLSLEDMSSLSTAERLKAVAQAYVDSGRSAEAFTDVAQILGERAGPQLLEVLNRISRNGLSPEDLIERGAFLSDEQVQQLDWLEDQIQLIKDALKFKVGTGIADALSNPIIFSSLRAITQSLEMLGFTAMTLVRTLGLSFEMLQKAATLDFSGAVQALRDFGDERRDALANTSAFGLGQEIGKGTATNSLEFSSVGGKNEADILEQAAKTKEEAERIAAADKARESLTKRIATHEAAIRDAQETQSQRLLRIYAERKAAQATINQLKESEVKLNAEILEKARSAVAETEGRRTGEFYYIENALKRLNDEVKSVMAELAEIERNTTKSPRGVPYQTSVKIAELKQKEADLADEINMLLKKQNSLLNEYSLENEGVNRLVEARKDLQDKTNAAVERERELAAQVAEERKRGKEELKAYLDTLDSVARRERRGLLKATSGTLGGSFEREYLDAQIAEARKDTESADIKTRMEAETELAKLLSERVSMERATASKLDSERETIARRISDLSEALGSESDWRERVRIRGEINDLEREDYRVRGKQLGLNKSIAEDLREQRTAFEEGMRDFGTGSGVDSSAVVRLRDEILQLADEVRSGDADMGAARDRALSLRDTLSAGDAAGLIPSNMVDYLSGLLGQVASGNISGVPQQTLEATKEGFTATISQLSNVNQNLNKTNDRLASLIGAVREGPE